MDAGDSGSRVRLRQAVLVARELERAAGELQAALGLPEPFRDPGVGMFGLANTVFAVGDSFLEIVSPVQPDTAAGRYLDPGEVRFTPAPGEAAEGLVEISLTLPPDVRAGREQLELGGVRFSLADAP